MPELDIVRDLAKQALTAHTLTGKPDNFLWDRAQRLIRNAELICQLPELANAEVPIDRFALHAATYFSDAGLVRYLETEKTKDKSAFPDTNGDNLTDFCIEVVEEKLNGTVEKTRIEKINRIITENSGNFTKMTEAMILSDACNLDDMGATGIFNEFKRFVSTGKGTSDVLQIWKMKIDYRYWQARLRKSFRFESVRKLAEQRLAATEHFMNQLKVETEAQDLEELSVNSALA